MVLVEAGEDYEYDNGDYDDNTVSLRMIALVNGSMRNFSTMINN